MKQFVAIILSLLILSSCVHVSREAKHKQALDFMDAAKSLMATQQYREALAELLNAEKLDPSNQEIQYLLASNYFFGFHRHEDAVEHIEKAIKVSKEGYPEAQNLYGVILLDQGKVKEAIGYLDKASKNLLYTTVYFAEQNLGEAYTQLGNLEEANRHFRQALMQQPKLCGAYLPLAKNLRQLKKIKEAENTLQNLIHNCDNERLQKFVPSIMLAAGYYELGLLQFSQKNFQAAKGSFTTCYQRFNVDETAAKCLMMLGRVNSN